MVGDVELSDRTRTSLKDVDILNCLTGQEHPAVSSRDVELSDKTRTSVRVRDLKLSDRTSTYVSETEKLNFGTGQEHLLDI